MKCKDVIRACIKARNMSQTQAAEAIGFKRQSNVAELLTRDNFQTDKFIKIMDALGFDIIIKDRNGANRENCWKIEVSGVSGVDGK